MDEASEILDHLPVDPSTLSQYINHLWGAFEALVEKEQPVSAFAILPFHLLFMFTIQYKIMRISAYDRPKYLEILSTCHLRNSGHERILRENAPIPDESGVMPSTSSVRNLSFLPEKKLFEFLKIIEVEETVISNAQTLAEIRSTYAHANGNIEEQLGQRIEEYLEIVRAIQPKMTKLNDLVGDKWLSEIETDEDGQLFIESRISQEYLSQLDMQQGSLAEFDKHYSHGKYQIE